VTEVPSVPNLILGVGNIIMGDDGFGVHVARRLKDAALPPYVRVEEGGVGGLNLLGLLEGVGRLIIVDTMVTDKPDGELVFFRPGQGFGEPGKKAVSFHQLGVLELLQMWSLLGHEIEVYFLVTRPQNLSWGSRLSPPLQTAVDRAVEFLQELVCNNFASLERGVPCM